MTFDEFMAIGNMKEALIILFIIAMIIFALIIVSIVGSADHEWTTGVITKCRNCNDLNSYLDRDGGRVRVCPKCGGMDVCSYTMPMCRKDYVNTVKLSNLELFDKGDTGESSLCNIAKKNPSIIRILDDVTSVVDDYDRSEKTS